MESKAKQWKKRKVAKFKVSVSLDESGVPTSELKADALPKPPEQKGEFMIMTHEFVKELERRYAHGDAGRVHFFLLQSISRKTGLIHMTQKQMADKMNVDKSLVSRGMRQLLADDLVRRTTHMNFPAFVLRPGVNKGAKRAKRLWDEAGQLERERQEEAALSAAAQVVKSIQARILAGETEDAAISAELATVKDVELRRHIRSVVEECEAF